MKKARKIGPGVWEIISAGPSQALQAETDYYSQGLALEATDPEASIEAYKKEIEFGTYHTWAFNNIGTHCYRKGRFKEAEEYYRKALEIDPDYPRAHFNLGLVLDIRGDNDRAQNQYRRVIEIDSHFADAHFNLALLLEKQGDLFKAFQHWKIYVELDSSNQRIKSHIQFLKKKILCSA